LPLSTALSPKKRECDIDDGKGRSLSVGYKASAPADYAGLDVDIMPALLADLPRFVWRVMVRVDDKLQLDFLFDATGVAHDELLVHAVSTKEGYSQMLAALALATPGAAMRPQVRAILKRFLVSPIAAGS
jgi:hypothetical protein